MPKVSQIPKEVIDSIAIDSSGGWEDVYFADKASRSWVVSNYPESVVSLLEDRRFYGLLPSYRKEDPFEYEIREVSYYLLQRILKEEDLIVFDVPRDSLFSIDRDELLGHIQGSLEQLASLREAGGGAVGWGSLGEAWGQSRNKE